MVEVKREIVAELASLIPGAERVDAFTIRFKAKDAVDVLRFVELVTFLGAATKVLLPKVISTPLPPLRRQPLLTRYYTFS